MRKMTIAIFAFAILMFLFTELVINIFESGDDMTVVEATNVDRPTVKSELTMQEMEVTEEVLRENPPIEGPYPVWMDEEDILTKEEIDLIALVTMAEAEGECEEGKRLVIDTILNRVDDYRFPDTVHDVIYQTNAFESLWNGRVDRCYVMDEIVQLVKEEMVSRRNYECVYFCAGDYSIYGTPLFKVDHHYFSAN